jgi:hypothetical protein
MKTTRTVIACVAVSAVLVTCGLVHGLWTDRWSPAAEPAEAAKRFDDIPMSIGDWEGQPLEHKSMRGEARVARSEQRRYTHRGSSKSVILLLVCGRFGPVSIHEPEACYGASGFRFAARHKYGLPGSRSELWTADAERVRAAETEKLRLYWAWNDGSGWSAAADPRTQFARRPVLHKLYVQRELDAADEGSGKEEPCEEFLRVLLPALDRALFGQ